MRIVSKGGKAFENLKNEKLNTAGNIIRFCVYRAKILTSFSVNYFWITFKPNLSYRMTFRHRNVIPFSSVGIKNWRTENNCPQIKTIFVRAVTYLNEWVFNNLSIYVA